MEVGGVKNVGESSLSSWAFVSIDFVNDPFRVVFFLEFISSSGFSKLTFTEPDPDRECN